jgi:hypothetical protein
MKPRKKNLKLKEMWLPCGIWARLSVVSEESNKK